MFCDVVLDGDAGEIAIIPVAFPIKVGVPVVVCVVRGEKEPLQDLIAQASPNSEVSVPTLEVHKSVPFDIERTISPEPLKQLVPPIEARPPELVKSRAFCAQEVIVEAALPQNGDGQALVTGGKFSEARDRPFIPSALRLTDSVACSGR